MGHPDREHPPLPDVDVASQPTRGDGVVIATWEDIQAVQLTQPRNRNNTALQWFRDLNEMPRGQPMGFAAMIGLDLSQNDPMEIGVVQRTIGEDHEWVEGERQQWSWRQMLKRFTEQQREQIMGRGDGSGVSRIWIQPLAGTHDDIRWRAATRVGNDFTQYARVPIWAFHVERSDGTVIHVHPNQTNKRLGMPG